MMKKLIIFSLFTLVLIFLIPSISSADVPPENSHPLDRCVKIVNLNEFPNIILIGYSTGPTIDTYEAYQIENNKCLDKGYKFNKFSIYWATKEKFNSIDLKNLTLNNAKTPTDITLLLENIETDGGYVEKSNPLIKEDIEYSLAGNPNEKLTLNKSKQISEYNDGTPKKVEDFNNPQNNTPTPEPAKKGFWQSIVCFFKKLFGGSC